MSYSVEVVADVVAATRHASSAASFIVVSAIIMAAGIALGVRRRQGAAFFVRINDGSNRKQALNRIFGTGIPVFGRVIDKPADPAGAGPVEGVFELGDGLGNLRTAPGDVSDVLVPDPLLVSHPCETFPKLTFGGGRFVGPLLSVGQPGSSVGDGVVIVTSPPAPPGFLESPVTVGQGLLGLVALADHVG